MPMFDEWLEEAEERRAQEARDRELKRLQEEEEQQRKDDLLGEQVKDYAKKRLKQEVERRVVSAAKKKIYAAAGRAVVSAIAAIAPWLAPILIIILIIALVLLVIVMTIAAVCNPSATGRLAGIIGGSLGPVGGLSALAGSYFCDSFQGLGGALGGAIEQGQNLMCKNPQVLAAENNVPYRRTESPVLIQLTDCIERGLARKGLDWGSRFTYEVKNEFCNYNRGLPFCGSCAHTAYSCHYGGRSGTRGAEAVDYGNEKIAADIIKEARACGAGFILNEGDRIHISTQSCNGN